MWSGERRGSGEFDSPKAGSETLITGKGCQLATRKVVIMAVAMLIVSAVAMAAAPSEAPRVFTKRSTTMEPETNEQIVNDFLTRKDRAEKAQRAIVAGLRRTLDLKRLEFEESRKKFDEARGRYAEIVGPLAKQGVASSLDPRLPYEFDVQRLGPEAWGAGPGTLSRKGADAASK